MKGGESIRVGNVTFVLGLSILIAMSQPVVYAKPVSLFVDQVGDEFLWDLMANKVVMSVGRRDLQYISFSDVMNVKMRMHNASLLMTWHVLGEVPIRPEDEFVNFAYFIWMSATEEGLLNFPYPGDYPFVAVIMGYDYQFSPPHWYGEVIVLTSPSEGQRLSLDYTVNKRTLEASIFFSILPFAEFYWMGGTTYQNRTLRDSNLALHDLTSFAHLG